MSKIKDGDIFRWSYKDDGDHLRYWAKSRIAIAKNGVLSDTFSDSEYTSRWTYADAEKELDLRFMGNMNEIEPIKKYDVHYYDRKDIVDITHSNSYGDKIYLKKGAVKSFSAIKDVLMQNIARRENQISHLTDRLEDEKAILAEVEAGKDLSGVYVCPYEG